FLSDRAHPRRVSGDGRGQRRNRRLHVHHRPGGQSDVHGHLACTVRVDHQLSEHLDYEGGPVLRGRVDRASGFTIIEMIVPVSIFSILVALTVPTMRKWIANTKVRAVADALQNGVRLAQAESLRRSRQVVFALTNSTTPQSGF